MSAEGSLGWIFAEVAERDARIRTLEELVRELAALVPTTTDFQPDEEERRRRMAVRKARSEVDGA